MSNLNRFLVSRTYEVVSEESAAQGDFEETGFVFERVPMTLRETVSQLEECSEVSSWPVSRESLNGREWASTGSEQDWRTGDYRSESVHVLGMDGEVLDGRNLYRLFKLAGLAK